MKSFYLSIILSSLLLLTSCRDTTVTPYQSIDIDFKLMDTNNVVKTTFTHVENIQFYFRMTNKGDDFTIAYSDGCSGGVFYIYMSDVSLGNSTDGRICSSVFVTKQFARDQSFEQRDFWVYPSGFNQHNYLSPGNYKAIVRPQGLSYHGTSRQISFEKLIEFSVTP